MLGSRLLELRTEKGLTQTDVALAVGISYISVGNYENGTRIPNADVVVKLADYFDVKTDYLLCRTNNREDIMPEISDSITQVWKFCSEDGQLSKIFNNMLEIMKHLKYSFDLYESPYALNEFVSESKRLFFELNEFYKYTIQDIPGKSNMPIRDLIKIAEGYVNVINARLNELMWLPFETRDSILNVQKRIIITESNGDEIIQLGNEAANDLLESNNFKGEIEKIISDIKKENE